MRDERLQIDLRGFALAGKIEKRRDDQQPRIAQNPDDHESRDAQAPDEERDVRGALAFLDALEQELSASAQKSHEGLKALYRARKFLMDKGSLLKPLLEQVALLTPKV